MLTYIRVRLGLHQLPEHLESLFGSRFLTDCQIPLLHYRPDADFPGIMYTLRMTNTHKARVVLCVGSRLWSTAYCTLPTQCPPVLRRFPGSRSYTGKKNPFLNVHKLPHQLRCQCRSYASIFCHQTLSPSRVPCLCRLYEYLLRTRCDRDWMVTCKYSQSASQSGPRGQHK